MKTAPHRRARTGFTIVELMIALTVGGVAVSSLYAMGAASTRFFREQQRVSTTQSSLRAAMNQVKRDFQRAGFLGTPNAELPNETCNRGQLAGSIHDTSGIFDTGRLAAISAYRSAADPPASLDPDRLNPWATVSDVILSGNYSTSGEYMGVTLQPDRMTVTIPMSSQSFRRDFTHWYATNAGPAGQCDALAFSNAFAPGRLARLHSLTELDAFGLIDRVSCNDATGQADIRLTQALPATCNPTAGWVSPLNFIRYQVQNARDGEDSRIGDNRVSVLRRFEVRPDAKSQPLQINQAGTVRAADDRAVLDFVVRFNVRFLRHDGGANTVNFVAADVDKDVYDNPERVRGVIIELAARTAEHEPSMIENSFATRVQPFRVFDMPGAARTRSMRAELFLPNITYEGY